jgi:hypothetical protein
MKDASLRSSLKFGLLFVALLFGSLQMFSQANTGRILGSVTDQTGGAISGATVTVTDTERGTTRTLTTDESGAYDAPSLIPGNYTVRGEYRGFKSTERQNIVLEVGKEDRIDLELQPGEQTEKVTVTEALPLVETTNAVLGGTLQPGTIEDLPLNGRNFMKLLDLRPGVTTYIGGGAWTQSTNGLRPEHNVYILDGITGMEPLGGQSTINSVSLAGDAASLLPIDTIQEFNVQQNPKAEFGWKPGAITNIALKSGTNAWHGTANAFGRTDKLDARNPFLTGINADGSTQKQRIGLEEFGATFGGPVKKDKMFFFLAYEGQRYNVGNPNAFTFPSLTAGAGAKNSLVDACLADKAAGTALSATSLTVSGLDGNCARTTGYSIFDLSPTSFLRDGTSPATSVNVSASLDTNYSVDDGLAKFDFQLNNKNTLNAKYFIGGHRGLVVNSQTITQPFWRPDDQAYTQFAGAQWNFTPTSAMVNTVRFGFNNFYQRFLTADCSGANGAPDYGINLINNPPNCGFTNVTITGFTGSIGCCSSFPKFYGPDHIYEVVDDLSILHGKHSFKTGFEVRASVIGHGGTFNRGRGQVTFDDLQSFLAGNLGTNNGQVFLGDPRRHVSGQAYAAFFQDDWRITQRLIVNLGLRYEYQTPIDEANNLLSNWTPTDGFLQLGVNTKRMWNADKNNFAPRLGFAWDIGGNGKTVVRGGGTVIYVTPTWWEFLSQQNQNDPVTGLGTNPSGFQICTPTVASGSCAPGPGTIAASGLSLSPAQVNWNQSAALYAGNIYPASSDTAQLKCGTDKLCTAQATNENLRSAYVMQWSLGIQRSITNNLSLSLDYVGNRADKLMGLEYTNTPRIGAGWTGATGATPGVGGSGQLGTCFAVFNGTKKALGTACSPGVAGGSAIQLARPYAAQYPYLSYIYTVSNPFVSDYHGMQIALTQRNMHGLAYTVGYTWSHALDQSTGERGGPSGNPFNQRLEYSNSEFDIRQRFTATVTYALPGRKGFGQMLEGWKVTSIVALQTALPWGVLGSRGSDPSGTGEFQDRWNFYGNVNDFSALGTQTVPYFSGNIKNAGGFIVPNPALPAACASAATALDKAANNKNGTAALYRWGCFVQGSTIMIPPALGTIGNMTRDMFRGNPFRNWDASVIKDWRFTERFSGEFRFEVFNLMNATHYGNPQFNGAGGNTPFGAPTLFGASAATPDVSNNNPALGSGGPREFQLGFRLSF